MSPPVGTQLLGTILRQRGYSVELFDSRLLDADLLLGAVGTFDPHIVGLSFLSPSSADALALGRLFRQDGRFVIAGGVHASIHSGDVLLSGSVDCVVRGEGEQALLDICEAFAEGRVPPAVIDGRAVQDMDSLPAYDSFGCYREAYEHPTTGILSVYLQFGRGCPMSCTFCELPNRAVFAPPRRRVKSIDRIMSEVHSYVRRWGINFVTVVDSIATLNLPLMIDFVERMDRELPDVGFMFNGHVNRFSRDLAERLGRAQAHRVGRSRITAWFGFESGSQRLLDFMRKDASVARAIEVAALCRRNDVQLGANLLLGVPTETAADYRMHDDFLAAIMPTFPNPNILTPLPGTQMYDYCVTNDIIRDRMDYSIWTRDRIEAFGYGPILGVDYGLALDAYRRYREEHVPREQYRSWASR